MQAGSGEILGVTADLDAERLQRVCIRDLQAIVAYEMDAWWARCLFADLVADEQA